jgi:hypothetical protein
MYSKTWYFLEQICQIMFRNKFSNKNPIFICRFALFLINAINFGGSKSQLV